MSFKGGEEDKEDKEDYSIRLQKTRDTVPDLVCVLPIHCNSYPQLFTPTFHPEQPQQHLVPMPPVHISSSHPPHLGLSW